jgi:hypothetical protein
MSYFYNYQDNTAAVKAGAAGFTGYSVIQRPDAYGGYNVAFYITGSSAYYHVHFASGGSRVKVVRYFSGGGGQGNNIIKHRDDGKADTLSTMIHGCSGYPNHVKLLTNLKSLVSSAKRTPAQELA